MVSISLVLLLTLSSLLIFFSHQPFFFVTGDDALIAEICSSTVQPVICSECLKSDPSSKAADAKGLAKIAISWAETDTTLLESDTDKYAKEAKDAESKKLLEDCALRFFHAKTEYDGVRSNVDAGAYGEAKGILSSYIIPEVNFCVDQFEKSPQLPIPGLLLGSTSIVKELCDVVAGVLNYLSG